MQKGDDRCGGTPGFLSRHMMVRYFLMVKDIHAMENWEDESNNNFDDLKVIMNEMTEEEKGYK